MSNTSKNLGVLAGLLILGAAGYAYLNPAFAATCKNTCSTSLAWVRQQAAPLASSFKNSKFFSSYLSALSKHKDLSRGRKEKKVAVSKPEAVKAAPQELSPEAVRKREQANWSIGQKIAHGPAFAQHAKEFGFKDADQMASHIDRVIGYAGPSTTKVIAGGRTVYWDDRTHAVVIVEANENGGTMYRPNEGYPYFKDLKPVQ